MSNIDLLKRLGLYIDTSFLSQDECQRIIAEAKLGKHAVAEVSDNAYDRLDEEIRRTKVLQVSQPTFSLIQEKLLALKSDLESKFHVSLTGCQNPQILHYKEGDFFIAHADTNDLPSTDKEIKDRQVSVVIFLNDRSTKPGDGEYAGGSLDLYGLIPNDPKWEKYGFPVSGKAGLLVAFPSETIHEVKEVTSGDRYTIVTWFV